MRIAHVISSPSGIGGAERVMLQLVAAGAERGWEQRVLHPFVEQGATEIADLCAPGTYLSHPCSHWRDTPMVWAWMDRTLRRFRPDVVHVHLFHALVLVASMRRPPGAQLVLTHHHGSRYVDEDQRLRERLDRLCGRRYDAVVAVSEATRSLLAERYGYRENTLRTIPNGWSGDPQPRNGPPGQRIICVANFRAQKGHDVLLTAFAQVLRALPEAELVLVGDGPLRRQLEDQSRRLGVAERVRFQGSVSDIWTLLANADVFALASRYEPLGIAVLEAMGAGLPIVATRVGGLADLIDPGVTGELVDTENPSGLAEHLIALLRSPEAIMRMGAAGRMRAAAHRADRMTELYLELYAELTGTGEFDRRTQAR
jgi:glycosyltransferase involved in cell wall biosynthesis